MSGSPPRPRLGHGAVAQVILFGAIWAALTALLGLATVAGTFLLMLTMGDIAGTDREALLGSQSPASLLSFLVTTSQAVATVLAVLLMRWIFRGPALLDLGLRPRPGWLQDTALGLVLGPMMFLSMLLVLLALGWVSVERGSLGGGSLAMAFVTFVMVALSEEVFSRGWVFQTLERGRGTGFAVVGSALIFTLLHSFNPGFGIMPVIGLFLAGLLFAQAYLVTRQLWLPITMHLSWNFTEGPLLGFPVSGLRGEGLLLSEPRGPELVTGGGFGPEAGTIVVVGIGVAAIAIALLGYWRATHAAPSADRN